jgi:hypothetical protein
MPERSRVGDKAFATGGLLPILLGATGMVHEVVLYTQTVVLIRIRIGFNGGYRSLVCRQIQNDQSIIQGHVDLVN